MLVNFESRFSEEMHMNHHSKVARAIQSEINEILYRYWNPIGMGDELPKNEYEAYAGPVYRALMNGKRATQIVELLTEMEAQVGSASGCEGRRRHELPPVPP